ncbi:MAG: type II toxin-antitoxin system VapC family toxin [Anaerolineaceae bacterium]|nr:type II toxin-antitoxin system VapC family toxin [Anaerolineaceae bacterium]
MIYTLDTNVCIRIINGRSASARAKLLSIPTHDIIVCSVVRAELYYGAGKSQTPEATRQKQNLFLSPFTSLPFDDLAANQYGQIRADLEQSGNVIGPLDLMIAAIAKSQGLILVTHNTREFSRILGLQLEDWE